MLWFVMGLALINVSLIVWVIALTCECAEKGQAIARLVQEIDEAHDAAGQVEEIVRSRGKCKCDSPRWSEEFGQRES